MLPAAGDRDQLIGAAGEFGADVVDDQFDIAISSDHPRQDTACHRFICGKDHRFDAAHPLAPAQLGRKVLQLGIQQRRLNVCLPAGRRFAHRYSPNSRNVGRPESSRTASSCCSRSNSRRDAKRDRLSVVSDPETASSLSSRKIT